MRQPTILIVDDNPVNLSVLGELLGGRYHIERAHTGAAALRFAAQAPAPDLVLLDVMMPDMSGYEVLHHLHAEPATQHIPVIFITAMSAPEDRLTALQLGAIDYLTKPIQPDQMLARIEAHFEPLAASA